MQRVAWVALTLVAISAGMWASSISADEPNDKPKYTIKEVMKLHKQKLHEKFVKGEASDEEKAKLLEAYEAMTACTPPKGEAGSWKERCESLVKAVKDDDTQAFEKAVNCMGCHKEHKK